MKRTFQPANAIANCDSPRLESERRAVALGLLEERALSIEFYFRTFVKSNPFNSTGWKTGALQNEVSRIGADKTAQ